MREIRVPAVQGKSEVICLRDPVDWPVARPGQPLNRVALAAAHVVADPLADIVPFQQAAIDMEATLRFRQYLWDLGLGVAEAMDTAQRGMGLDWRSAQAVIQETVGMARQRPEAAVFVGVGTDQLEESDARLEAVIRAYEEQIAFAQKLGARLIIMASRGLSRAARTSTDYTAVYDRILDGLDQPAILHWLGPMFDPALQGYWGKSGISEAMDVCLEVLHRNAAKVEGIKISLLDKEREVSMRRRLPAGVRMYTGDDFNYPELIAGDGIDHSDALLGIFDPLAPLASAALVALTEGNVARFHEILDPTVQLSREIFREPTQLYKTGVVFLAYLNGHQDHFVMLAGLQAGRALPHLVRVFRLAADIGLLRDPDLAVHRLRHVLALQGFEP